MVSHAHTRLGECVGSIDCKVGSHVSALMLSVRNKYAISHASHANLNEHELLMLNHFVHNVYEEVLLLRKTDKLSWTMDSSAKQVDMWYLIVIAYWNTNNNSRKFHLFILQ